MSEKIEREAAWAAKKLGAEKIARTLKELKEHIAELEKTLDSDPKTRGFREVCLRNSRQNLAIYERAAELCKDSQKPAAPRKKKQKTFYKRDLKKIAEILAEQGESIRLLNLKKG